MIDRDDLACAIENGDVCAHRIENAAGECFAAAQLCFRLFARRDVFRDSQDSNRLAFAVDHAAHAGVDPHARSVLAIVLEFSIPLDSGQPFDHRTRDRGTDFRWESILVGSPDHLSIGPTKKPMSPLVPIRHHAQGVGHDDRVIHVVQDEGSPC